MSTYSDIQDALLARLNTVANIGATHAYQRYNADWTNYLSQLTDPASTGKQVRSWMVTMDSRQPISSRPNQFSGNRRTYQPLIVGVMALKDADNTERTFWNLVESVLNALDGRLTLGVAGVPVYGNGPAEVRLYEIRQFGSVLCHYVEITHPVEVDVSVTYA